MIHSGKHSPGSVRADSDASATPAPPARSISRRRAGFTLVELLVVIGIILILMGLLFPAISAIRRQAAVSSTKQEMSRLQSAINAYYLDFRSYPGPFAEDQVYPQYGSYNGSNIGPQPYAAVPAGTGAIALSLNTNVGSAGFVVASGVNANTGITSSENLFLGLEGCLIYPGVNPTPVFWYTPPSAGPSGPASLNPNNPGVKASYMNYTPNETTFTQLSDMSAGLASNIGNSSIWANPSATDSSIPEYVDHFNPSRPILYMRAKVGVACTGTTNAMLRPISGGSGLSPTAYQYDENQLSPYGWAGQYSTQSNGSPSTTSMGVNTTDFPGATAPSGSGYFTYTSDEQYFANPGQWGVPQGKDTYILISAGPDGIYGDKDDIVMAGS